MQIRPTRLDGVFEIELDLIGDVRGSFARTFCAREFAAAGLDPVVVQCNVSFNPRRATLRGLHYQRQPHAEAKLVRCVTGAIYDVAVDVRRPSPTFGRWIAVELSAAKPVMLYIAKGFAHGFQTLTDDAQVLYNMSDYYAPASATGVRWNDPALAIPWPLPEPIVSDKDNALPLLADLD